jgi:hypothetical protein
MIEVTRRRGPLARRLPSWRRAAQIRLALLAMLTALLIPLSGGVATASILPAFDNLAIGVSTSTNHALWATPHQIWLATYTAPNKAYFWTGRNSGISVEQYAAQVASNAGGVTLELALKRAHLTMPAWNVNDNASMALWKLASVDFAEQAFGEVHVVKGWEIRSGNVWESLEFPELKDNIWVNTVVEIHSWSGTRVQIWYRYSTG